MNIKNSIKTAVIGDPISQSLSPKIHNYWFEKYQISGNYQAIKVEKNNLIQEVEKLIDQGFAGFNATIPHKETVFNICHKFSETARICKAVNTLVIMDDKKIFGHNSDADGFINSLKKNYTDFNTKNKTAHLIGSGGAARAILYSLIKAGFKKIIITNRSEEKAEKMISDFSHFALKYNANVIFTAKENFYRDLINSDLLINSTSLGMANQDKLDFDLTFLNKSAIVCDIVYKPLMTDLLISAKNNGNKILTGIHMLIEQAAVGFQIWAKTKIEIDQEIIDKTINWSNY